MAATPIHDHDHDHDHDHEGNDETAYKRKSPMTAVIDGTARRLTADQSICLKRGVPHPFLNVSRRPTRHILIGTPAMFDRSSRKLAGSARGVKQ
ncbi:hypothetical protein [Ensifer sp. SSB1]|uniref:hypothetical protein n=1 Tax=Ensifer sp. SSB1 TaxID=2795385 RepID=UPI0025BCDF3A|nr:hypothetical protein [Ensifer sp. SSB1]